ncbi:MAG: hypothetical protein V5A36_02350, partial [Natronomonas sp.]
MTSERITITGDAFTTALGALAACVIFVYFDDRDADITKRECDAGSQLPVRPECVGLLVHSRTPVSL